MNVSVPESDGLDLFIIGKSVYEPTEALTSKIKKVVKVIFSLIFGLRNVILEKNILF